MTADDTKIQRLSRLFKMTVHVDNPQLYFMGMMKAVPAFLVFELQAQFVVAILLGKCQLPDKSDMLSDIEEEHQLKLSVGYPPTKVTFQAPVMYFIKRFQNSLLTMTEEGWIRPIPSKVLAYWDNYILALCAHPNGYRLRQYPLDTVWDTIDQIKPPIQVEEIT